MMGVKVVTKSRMLITDQVAIAPCTDPTQVAIPTFEAKPRRRSRKLAGNL